MRTAGLASLGVLFRDAEALELLRQVDTVLIDKTGTLTEGKPKLVTVEPTDGTTAEELLLVAAALEGNSEHPLAAAMVRGAVEQRKGNGSEPQQLTDFQSVTGKGVRAKLNGRPAAIGNAAMMAEEHVDIAGLERRLEELRAHQAELAQLPDRAGDGATLR